jgi:hypothetical protein
MSWNEQVFAASEIENMDAHQLHEALVKKTAEGREANVNVMQQYQQETNASKSAQRETPWTSKMRRVRIDVRTNVLCFIRTVSMLKYQKLERHRRRSRVCSYHSLA